MIGAFRLNSIALAVQKMIAATTGIQATGGTISYATIGGVDYKIHTFTTTGSNTFTVTSVPTGQTADILLVGGGGGPTDTQTITGANGGGGGGAVVYQTGVSLSSQSYIISIGAGGFRGTNGTSTTGLGFTAVGGGLGALIAGNNGGGSGANATTSYTATVGTAAYKGGNSFGSATAANRASGGGAGAGGAGGDASSGVGGNGGIGVQNNIDGQNLYYGAGGGGSGSSTAGSVYDSTGTLVSTASAGAGRTTTGTGNSNTTGTYGGGGGGPITLNATTQLGSAGRQGIVVIRYPAPSMPDGGTISYYAVGSTTYRIHAFTTAGSNSFYVPSGWTTPVELLLVGGGGASGSGQTSSPSGGGGAGQVVSQTNISVTNQTYSLTVGAAGAAPGIANTVGGTGGTSTALGYTATGGGGGGYGGAGTAGPGASGASGGGGGGAGGTTGVQAAGGTATTSGVTGYAGGSGYYFGSGTAGSGGGGGFGGAGTAATNPSQSQGGNGGAGYSTTFITGSAQTIAGGGGGGGTANGTTPSVLVGSGAAASTSTSGTAGKVGGVYIRYPVTGVTSYSFVTSVTSITTSLTFPTIQTGDIVFYYNTAFNTTTTIPTQIIPTGFTNRYNTTASTTLGGRSCMYTKICDGTESGTTITNMSGTSSTSSILLVYRPNIPLLVGFTMGNNGSVFADTAPSNQTLSWNLASQLGFGLEQWAASSSITTRTSSVTPTREVGTSNGLLYVKVWEVNNFSTSFANSTNSMADYGTNSFANNIVRIA
jgi:hypothetical protein